MSDSAALWGVDMHNGSIWCNLKVAMRASISVAGILITEPAIAQTSAQNAAPQQGNPGDRSAASKGAAEIDDILVTGSNIRGNRNLSTSLATISRDDFEKSGFLDVGQAVNSLPQSFGGGFSFANGVAGVTADLAVQNSSRATSPNLRGLGVGATLTLLDGSRLPSAGAGLAVDISMIPTAAIERVEVLADGASATYGADAVAGVVNIITRKHFDGVEARALYGTADGGLGTYRASLLTGLNIGRFSAVLSGEYLRQNRLSAGDRAATSKLPLPYDLSPFQKRGSAMGSATFEVSDHFRLFADGLWSLSKMNSRDTNTSQTEAVDYRNEERVFSAGAESDIGSSWHAKLTGRLAHNESIQTYAGAFSNGSAFGSTSHRITNLRTVDFIADGNLFDLPGGSVKASFGSAFRDEDVRSATGKPKSVGRSAVSVFGELSVPFVSPEQDIPLVQSLSLSAAGRYDRYSQGLGSAFVPKFVGAWGIGKGFEIRGAYSQSYRVPSLYEQTALYQAYLFNVKDNVPSGKSTVLYLDGTGRQLSPERSQNVNIQIRYHPEMIKGLSLSLGYYQFLYHDRIAKPDPTARGASDITNLLASTIIRTPAQQQLMNSIAGATNGTGNFGDLSKIVAVVDERLTNISKTKISGLEGELSYKLTTGRSTFGFNGNVNYIDKFEDYFSGGSAATSRVGTVFSPSHWRSRTQASWNRGNFSTAVAWNYVGAYDDNRLGSAATVPVDAWNTFDLSLTVHLTGGRERDTRLTLAATNLFNARPPYISATTTLRAANFDPTNASAIGRFVSIELVKKW